ncbi:hypothetical protein Tco_0048944, partial [Tanacetum coccineum]
KEPSPGFGIGSLSALVNTKPPKDVEEPKASCEEETSLRSSSSRAVRAKTSASKDDARFLSISDDDEGLPDCFELKDANAYHLKISAITPTAWRGHLDNQMDLELLNLHDRCFTQQDVVDITFNRRA